MFFCFGYHLLHIYWNFTKRQYKIGFLGFVCNSTKLYLWITTKVIKSHLGVTAHGHRNYLKGHSTQPSVIGCGWKFTTHGHWSLVIGSGIKVTSSQHTVIGHRKWLKGHTTWSLVIGSVLNVKKPPIYPSKSLSYAKESTIYILQSNAKCTKPKFW